MNQNIHLSMLSNLMDTLFFLSKTVQQTRYQWSKWSELHSLNYKNNHYKKKY